MNQKGVTLVWLLGGVLIVVAMIAGIYYFDSKEPEEKITDSTPYPTTASTNPTINSPIPSSSVEDWLLYQNLEWQLTIKYPSSLYLNSTDNSVLFTFVPVEQGKLPPLDNIEISSNSYLNEAVFQSLFNATEGSDVPEAHNAVDVKITKLRNLKVGNYNAVEYIRDGVTTPKSGLGRGAIGYEHNLVVKKDKTFIRLVNESMDPELTKKQDIIFNKMLATLEIK